MMQLISSCLAVYREDDFYYRLVHSHRVARRIIGRSIRRGYTPKVGTARLYAEVVPGPHGEMIGEAKGVTIEDYDGGIVFDHRFRA